MLGGRRPTPATAAQTFKSNQFTSLHTHSNVAHSITAARHLSQTTSTNEVECGFFYNQLQQEVSDYSGLPRDKQVEFGERNNEVFQTLDVQAANSVQLFSDGLVVGSNVVGLTMPSRGLEESPRSAASGIVVINGPPSIPENRVSRDIAARGFEEVKQIVDQQEAPGGGGPSSTDSAVLTRRSIYITDGASSRFPSEAGGAGFAAGDLVYVMHTPVNVNAGLYIVKQVVVAASAPPYGTRLDVEVAQQQANQASRLAKLLSVANTSFVPLDFRIAPGYSNFSAPYGTVRKVVATFMLFTEGPVPPFDTKLEVISGDSVKEEESSSSLVAAVPLFSPPPSAVSISSPFDDFNITESPVGTFTVDVGKAFTRKTINPNHYSLVIAGRPSYQGWDLAGSVILKGGDDTTDVSPPISGVTIAKSTIVGHSAATAYSNSFTQDSEFFGYFSGHRAATQGTAFGAFSHASTLSELSTAAGHSAARYRLFRGVCAGAHSSETINSEQGFNTSIGAFTTQFGGNRLVVALGAYAAHINPGSEAIAIGAHAGESAPGDQSICIGYNAGNSNMLDHAIAIGENCAAPKVPRRIAFGSAMEPIQPSAAESGVDSVGPVPAQTAGYIPIEWNGELVHIPVYLP